MADEFPKWQAKTLEILAGLYEKVYFYALSIFKLETVTKYMILEDKFFLKYLIL